ncbi:hypothetical protein B0H21DRAFT_665702, partial [Amylocystis lapponica]
VSSQEAQTVKYLNEILSHRIRSFASGLFIENQVMHLWYGDRMGLVKSCVFNWQNEPALTALVFAAFGTANLMQLGISPFFKLQQKAPSYLRHIVDLKCFVTRTVAEMGLPRAFMDIELAEEDKRDFRLMIMRKYEPLESINGMEEFKAVFEHVVRAHHWVWTTSGILYRDISTENIMFYRDTEGHVVGML